MKKFFLLIALIVVALALSSCGRTGDHIESIGTEVVSFDIDIAREMIEARDQIIADITVKDAVSREVFDQFLHDIYAAYGGFLETEEWAYMFFYNEEVENEQIKTLRLNQELFYPTVLHEDVDVVSARIENIYYENDCLNTSDLIIREAYLGEDENLADWYRDSVYRKNDKDKWELYAFTGQVNLGGEEFSPDYLALKE